LILMFASSRRAVLGYFGFSADDEDGTSLPVSHRIFQSIAERTNQRVSHVIYISLLALLFLLAVMASLTESDLNLSNSPSSSSGHLRTSIEPEVHSLLASNSTITSTVAMQETKITSIPSPDAAGNVAGRSTSSFWLSMMTSFLSWICLVQLFRCFLASRFSSNFTPGGRMLTAGGGRGAAAANRESIRLLTQLMQMGRGGGRGFALSNRLRLAMLNRDFTGDDYEMLQQLEENSGPVVSLGAEEREIERLPLHVVTEVEVAENEAVPGGAPTCNVCLGPYEVGDEIRTVRCMHKFHKHCIDTWLRTNATCPICKHRATE